MVMVLQVLEKRERLFKIHLEETFTMQAKKAQRHGHDDAVAIQNEYVPYAQIEFEWNAVQKALQKPLACVRRNHDILKVPVDVREMRFGELLMQLKILHQFRETGQEEPVHAMCRVAEEDHEAPKCILFIHVHEQECHNARHALAVSNLGIHDRVRGEHKVELNLLDAVAVLEHNVIAECSVDVEVDLPQIGRLLLGSLSPLLVDVGVCCLFSLDAKYPGPRLPSKRVWNALVDTTPQLFRAGSSKAVPVGEHLGPLEGALPFLDDLLLLLLRLLAVRQLLVMNETVAVNAGVYRILRLLRLVNLVKVPLGAFAIAMHNFQSLLNLQRSQTSLLLGLSLACGCW
eukprot:Opistho-2@62402